MFSTGARVPKTGTRGPSRRVPAGPGSDGVFQGAVVAPAAQAVPLVQETGGLVGSGGGFRFVR